VQINDLPAQSSAITALALNAPSDHVACGTADGTVHVWEVYSGTEVLRAAVSGYITCVALSPSATGTVKEVVVGTEGGELLVFRKVSTGFLNSCFSVKHKKCAGQ
jgi:WD40 repeat protein